VEHFWPWIALALLILSTVGTVMPFLPGLPVMALVVIGYGWLEGFKEVDSWLVIVTLALTVSGMLLDYFSGPYTAKKTGASRAGIWGAFLGGIGGIFILGPVGLLLGPFLGAMAGELLFGKNLSEASKTGLASLLGFFAGSIIKLCFAVTITISFFIKVIL